MIKIETIYQLLGSSDINDVRMAVGLTNAYIDTFTEEEKEYIGYICPAIVYPEFDKKVMDSFLKARTGIDFTTYEKSLPINIVYYRNKVIVNLWT